ncbi:MAG: hypothetical protein AAF623_21065, partial [Planctomycetota bacterium]
NSRKRKLDPEIDPVDPRLSVGDALGLAFSFVWFYRRIWIGTFLLIGLGLFLNYLMQTRASRTIQPEQKTAVKSIPLPNAKIGTISVAPKTESLDSSAEMVEAKRQLDESGQPNTKLEKLLASENIFELIDQSLEYRDRWPLEKPVFAMLLNRDRMRISRRLMQLDLTLSQTEFAQVSYIEAVSVLDSIQSRFEFKVEGLQNAVAELDGTLTEHPSAAIASKAHLAIALAWANRFYYGDEPNALDQFWMELENRHQKIALEPSSIIKLGQVIKTLLSRKENERFVFEKAVEFSDKVEALGGEQLREALYSFRMDLIFGEFELATFADLVAIDDEDSRLEVRKLFKTVESFPNVDSRVYRACFDAIRVYYEMERYVDARSLADWLEKIIAKMSAQTNREIAMEALKKLRLKWDSLGVSPAENSR